MNPEKQLKAKMKENKGWLFLALGTGIFLVSTFGFIKQDMILPGGTSSSLIHCYGFSIYPAYLWFMLIVSMLFYMFFKNKIPKKNGTDLIIVVTGAFFFMLLYALSIGLCLVSKP